MINLNVYIVLPILTGTLLYLFRWKYMKRFVVFIHGFLFVASVHGFIYVKNFGTIMNSLGSWGHYGIVLYGDLVSMTLLMLTSFMFFVMLMYDYQAKYANRLFLFLFLILQSLISAIFLSNDLFNIFVLIEVATIVVSILIMFKQDKQSVYDGILYMLVNIVAMNFFLFGIAFMYRTFGVLDLSLIHEKMPLVTNPATLILPYALMMTAVGLKSAIMPLFSWLPKAHGTPSAPSTVSGILSGLYVKTGVYLFLRISHLFYPVIDGRPFFLVVGFITAIVGFMLAIAQTDIKLILAYHTISQIGLIMVGLNYPTEYAYWGGIYHIMNHAFFKSTLFLGAGMMIDHYKTRNIWQIRGVLNTMPVAGWASLLAVLGITGAPFFNGSISKYLIQTGTQDSFMEWGIMIINLGTIISFIKYSHVFLPDKQVAHTKKPLVNGFQNTSILVLGIICVIGGIWGQSLISILFNQEMTIPILSQLEKGAIYILSLAVGYLIYKYFVLKTAFFKYLKLFELDFNGICLSLTGFMVSIFIYLSIIYI